MTDKKFTDEEIIKRLERCVKRGNRNYNTDIVLDLINRQKSENLELRLKVNELLAYKQEVTKNNIKNYETYKSQKSEIERLKGSTIVNNIMESQRIKREAKAEAYKEFARKLKEKDFSFCIDAVYDGSGAVKVIEINQSRFNKQIDNLLKEMVGEEE